MVRPDLGTDTGAVVLGWLTKVAVSLLVVGISLFDVVAIGAAHLSLSDDANAAAGAANSTWNDTRGNVQAAYNSAEIYAEAHGATVTPGTFKVFPDGRVSLELKRTATTLVVRHVGPLRHLAQIDGHGTATSPTI